MKEAEIVDKPQEVCRVPLWVYLTEKRDWRAMGLVEVTGLMTF